MSSQRTSVSYRRLHNLLTIHLSNDNSDFYIYQKLIRLTMFDSLHRCIDQDEYLVKSQSEINSAKFRMLRHNDADFREVNYMQERISGYDIIKSVYDKVKCHPTNGLGSM